MPVLPNTHIGNQKRDITALAKAHEAWMAPCYFQLFPEFNACRENQLNLTLFPTDETNRNENIALERPPSSESEALETKPFHQI